MEATGVVLMKKHSKICNSIKLYTVKPEIIYSKTCLKGPLKNDQKLFFKTDYRLLQVKRIVECSKGSILQYFRPSLSYHLSLRSMFLSIFESPLKTGFTV